MKRCYFLGLDIIYDSELMIKIEDELEKIIRSDDQIEFWFYIASSQYISSCLSLVVRIRSRYPEKNIKIVRVFDPIRYDKPSDWYDEAYNTTFPRCIPDLNIYAPIMADCISDSRAIQHANVIERWIIRQCNIIIAYFYPDLEHNSNYQIKHAINSGATVIHVCFEDTARFIQEQINTQFSERDIRIHKMLKDEKMTYREIGEIIGISGPRVTQIGSKITRTIRQSMMNRPKYIRNKKNMKCGLAGLNSTTSAIQLVVFESLLEHLIDKYNVQEFWIDERSCNTVFGAVLAKLCYKYKRSDLVVKVFVSAPENDYEKWINYIKEYVPPYSMVVNMKCDTSEWKDVCRKAIQQCDCFITDFSNPDAQDISNFFGNNGEKYLFDISAKKLDPDTKYI